MQQTGPMNAYPLTSAPIVRHHRLVFFLAIYVAYVVALFWFANVRDAGDPGRSLVRLLTPVVELSLLGMACAACMRMATRRTRRWPWILITGVIAATAAGVYLVQIYSLRISSNFISVLALQNADSIAFVQSPRLKLAVALAMLWVGLFCIAAALASAAPATLRRAMSEGWRSSVFISASSGLLLLFAYAITLQGRNPRLEPGFREAPMASLLANLYRANTDPAPEVPSPVVPRTADLGCFSFPEAGPEAPFPFQRTRAFRSLLPATGGDASRPPNIIVLFTEGLSARLVGAYGGRYPGLTPNIDRLAARSMRVDDYFNHTAATFRGLIGQLSSGFSYAGGGGAGGWTQEGTLEGLSSIRRQTLPLIANEAGYDTHFFAPHKAHRPIIGMLHSMGFGTVHTYESISHDWLGGRAVTRHGTAALDDASLYAGVVAFLHDREAAGERQPFFLATYNIGTHAFLSSADGEVPYGSGDNPVLDKVHNLDRALGEFLAYFEASPYARNTLLVLTSDHATYPEPPYREVAGSDLKPLFVDRIPLLVLDPSRALPATLEAEGRTSLDLAPTVLQLAGLQTRSNAFLGASLFEPRRLDVGIAALGSRYFLTRPDGVYGMDEIPEGDRADFDCAVEVVRRFYEVERDNRIFSGSNAGSVPVAR
ncbi:LTA synthase family protein [Marilutibacter penaei]|nr:sulfatase-like hydrolase/transferase [Lysobacter penaei]